MLFNRKEDVLEAITDLEGSLVIKEYPTKTATTNIIRAHMEKLKKRNHKIDMIIVDYADLLRPTTHFKEKRNELESIYENLRAIAQEFNCPVWTASHTNRSGLNAEVVTMESISEAFNKCFVADLYVLFQELERTKMLIPEECLLQRIEMVQMEWCFHSSWTRAMSALRY